MTSNGSENQLDETAKLKLPCPYPDCRTSGTVSGLKNRLRRGHNDRTLVLRDRGTRVTTLDLIDDRASLLVAKPHCSECTCRKVCDRELRVWVYGGARFVTCCKVLAVEYLNGPAELFVKKEVSW